MHSCFGGKTVVFKGTVDECNEFRHIIVAISLFCIVRRIGKVLINYKDRFGLLLIACRDCIGDVVVEEADHGIVENEN